jgi:hypothetical protein
MFKLYAVEDVAPVRVARQFKNLASALVQAKRIACLHVEVREALPSGKERLTAIVENGNVLAA